MINSDLSELKYKEIYTASANQTFAAQLTAIKPYYDALTNAQKVHSALLFSTGFIAKCIDTRGRFGRTDVGSTAVVNIRYFLDGSIVLQATTGASSTTFANAESGTNTDSLSLILI